MWVFDGEKWTEEGGSTVRHDELVPETTVPFDEFMPELQVIEHRPTPPTRTNYVPPVPLP